MPRPANPNGPNATDTHAPNSHQHPVVKVRVSRGTKLGNVREPDSQRNRHGKFKKGSRKWKQHQAQEHLRKLRDNAVKNGIVEHGLKPVEVLQRLIDDAYIDYAIEDQKAREAQEQGKRYSTALLRQLRKDAAYFASLALQYNIADRNARQQEIRTQLLATLLQQVLRDPQINLPEAKIRKIPALLEARANVLQEAVQTSPNGHEQIH